MSWIIKNDPPEPKAKSFQERMADLQVKVEGATEEELESWQRPELGDLCQAARIELRKRNKVQPNTNYDGIWIR